MGLSDELRKVVRGEVFDDLKTRELYSRDWSLFQVMPKAVVWPKDREDIKKLVAFAHENNISLTSRSAGTDMSGGPLNEGIILDFTKHINKLIEIGNDYAIAEPGMYYRDFEKETFKYGLLFPSYPASKGICALGGIIANNSGGEKSLTYGKTEQYISQIKMICSDGVEHVFTPCAADKITDEYSKKIYDLVVKNYDQIMASKPQVHKNSSGYALWDVLDKEKNIFDINKLIVGSQGTFGIITEATFKLIRPKEHSALLVLFIDQEHMKDLGRIVQNVLESKPESFESYDDHTFKIAIKYLPSLIKSMGTGGLFSLGIKFLPELWMAITGGIPKLVLTAEFTGDSEEEIYEKARKAEANLKDFKIKTHIAKNDQEENKYWTIRRQSFKLLTDHSKGKRTVPFIDDIVVRPEFLPEFLPQLQEIMSHYNLEFTIAGHIGEGNFHIIPLDKIGDEKLRVTVPELEEKVFSLVAKFHGSITGEHNDGIVRTPFLSKIFSGEMIRLFEETKKIFDPENIFNPGKKVGETVSYMVSHIDTDPKRSFVGD